MKNISQVISPTATGSGIFRSSVSSAVLLYPRKKARRHIPVRKYQRLAAERADLGAADVKGIRQLADIVQGEVVSLARKAVAHARPVHVQDKVVFAADLGERRKLRL